MAFDSDRFFMLQAIEQAEKAYMLNEVPVGAVITYDGEIIAASYNQVETKKLPFAHAEILALEKAQQKLHNKWLNNCVVYVTIEPCLMCGYALVLARVKKLVFGAAEPKSGAFGSVLDIRNFKFNHSFEVVKGIEESRCKNLIQSFFKSRR